MKNRKNRISLHTLLIVPYVILIVSLALIWGVLSYRSGRSISLSVIKYSLESTSQNIAQKIEQQILLNTQDILSAAFPQRFIDPQLIEKEPQSLIPQFKLAFSKHGNSNNNLYYGTSKGSFLAIAPESIESFVVFLKTELEKKRKVFLQGKQNSKLIFLFEEKEPYDPRQRQWYQFAKTNEDVWTPAYIDFGTNDLVITRSRKISNDQGNVSGVIATDIILTDLNNYIRSIDISHQGVAFIIEPDGKFIASSCCPIVKPVSNVKYSRTSIMDSEYDLPKEVYEAIRGRVGKSENKRGNGIFSFDVFSFTNKSGQIIHVSYSVFKDKSGLNWISVVALSEDAFMANTKNNIMYTVFFALLATLLVVLIGIFILKRVTGEIKALSLALKKANNGALNDMSNIGRTDEIIDLANNFNVMQERLKTDYLTKLPNRYALEDALEKSIKSAHANENPYHFVLMFIDINCFKKINDTHGHKMGDLVLVEVAQRMKSILRQEDLLVRFAGDEFIILIPGFQKMENLTVIKMKLLEELSRPLQVDNEDIQLYGASIGIARYPEDAQTAAELIKISDKKMYEHKQKQKFPSK